jgi:arsenate reductase-like glutaredoxin family protein
MDDKTFDLMGKMYTEMNSKFGEMNSRFDEMNSRFDEINIKLDKKADKNDIIRIEDKLENKTKALFDRYTQTYEKLTAIEKTLEHISIKVEKQDIEIRVIKNIAN